jgi:hypothetical protein
VLRLVRLGLPAVIATVGVVLVMFGDDAARAVGIVDSADRRCHWSNV